jgi:hypothetical protein
VVYEVGLGLVEEAGHS